MDKIQSHPWFIRRKPRAFGQLIAPPAPDQLRKPIGQAKDLDADILQNLRTLWHGSSKAEIIQALTSEGCVPLHLCGVRSNNTDRKSWHKVFYILLLKYRTKHMENFNMDEEEPIVAEKPKQKGRLLPLCPNAY
jgi:serine/threonine-protein kinase HSL1 (negative regulator of Swe1 kinase)